MARFVWYDTAQIPIIKRAVERGEWFTAITLSATQLERHSYWVIKEHLEFHRIDSKLCELLVEPLYLAKFAECLLAMKTIDKKEHDTIMKVNDARKYFVHRRRKEKFKRGLQAQETYKPLVDAAIQILEGKLGAKRLMVG